MLETKWVALSNRYEKAASEMLHSVVWILEELFRTQSVWQGFLEILRDICREPRNNAWCTWRTKGSHAWSFKGEVFTITGARGVVYRQIIVSEWMADWILSHRFLVREPVENKRIMYKSMLRLQQELRWVRSPLSFSVHSFQVYKTACFYCLISELKFQQPWARRCRRV